ncbi:neutral zinc metallopeptidase [Erythrobacter sp. THAF29]|uniref:KPN_02809 family neutral zinc metallopeptidase n=1 Tax=Erythrobacter sp. THAF29 TaxID=2587851 RepID=UPI00126930E9|nr:neutral zinc metallopeptidase [Erythrobacter sp. THAF29]QFT78076.1 Putative neutral zinc metallopeptidase [Erythrobacter sp. THAF29]
MRLNRFDTSKIKVRGGGSGMRRAGGVGCGTVIIAIIAAVIFGADPMQTIGMIEGAQQSAPQSQQDSMSEEELCTQNQYATEACNALTSLNETWQPEFARAGIRFEQPTLHLYPSGRVTTQGCGSASSAAGPFYCPADLGIYIDTNFYDQLARMSGTRGDFARLYVMAHEYGHHIQNLTGLADQVRSIQQRDRRRANDLQVRMELQADCYAGVWAGKNRNLIERGDLEEGMQAAAAIGDDNLQRQAGQRINPEAFTHGTSEQRVDALRRGFGSANDSVCDVYFE